jgi:hypothetical protein
VKLVTATVVLAALTAIAPPLAAADGDPASDYLLAQKVFLPFDAKIPTSKGQQLTQLVENANRAGFQIRVAVIATRVDLGSVTALWAQPQKYAEFLGSEIEFVYRRRLLVVMANGFGYSQNGKPLPHGPLAKLPTPGPQPTALVASATTAVQRLAAASGVRLALPHTATNDQTTRDRIIIIAAALTAVALLAAGTAVRRLRRARRP